MAIEKVEVSVLPEVQMNDDLAKAINDAVSPDAVRALLVAEAMKQVDTSAQLAADQAAAEKAATDKAAAEAAALAQAQANQPVRRTVTIGGRNFEFEGATEAEVDRLELNALKIAYAVRPEEQPAVVETVPDPAAVAAAAEAEVAAKAELERRFRLGEITAADYIEQTGAIKSYLEREGLSIDSLKETVETNKSAKYAQSWAEASEVFRNSSAGSDWPGGKRNQEIIGLKIASMGLEDAEDKVGALAQAYAALKASNAYFQYGDFNTETEWKTWVNGGQPVVQAASVTPVADAGPTPAQVEAARAAAAAKVRATSSSMFGASSGVSGAPVVSPTVQAAKTIVPSDATPAEILAAWKEENLKNGIDPNAAFTEAYRGRAR